VTQGFHAAQQDSGGRSDGLALTGAQADGLDEAVEKRTSGTTDVLTRESVVLAGGWGVVLVNLQPGEL
jgi:hypothetical protein